MSLLCTDKSIERLNFSITRSQLTFIQDFRNSSNVTRDNSSRDEIYEKNSRIHLDRLQTKYTNYRGIKNNTNFGQITGIQEKMDRMPHNRLPRVMKHFSNWQKESWQTFEETSGYVRLEQVNKCPNPMTDI